MLMRKFGEIGQSNEWGFRIIVYNNIITKFYTFQAERESFT